jgi:hypothetical protein
LDVRTVKPGQDKRAFDEKDGKNLKFKLQTNFSGTK